MKFQGIIKDGLASVMRKEDKGNRGKRRGEDENKNNIHHTLHLYYS